MSYPSDNEVAQMRANADREAARNEAGYLLRRIQRVEDDVKQLRKAVRELLDLYRKQKP